MRRLLPALAGISVAASGCAAAGEPGMGFRTVEITAEHSAFDPREIRVGPGETVRFVIRNTDPIDHEFILGDEAVQERHEDGTEPYHGERAGEVSVAAGEEAETTFTFGEPGTLIFGCHLPGHYDYGMRGAVRIG